MNTKRLEMMVMAVTLLGAATPAFADYGWVTCRTNSNGYQFQNADGDRETARGRTINDCTQNQFTNNGDCRYNASCDGDYPGIIGRCVTNSNGYTFRDAAPDLNSARDAAINDCVQNQFTNNGACRANVQCQGGNQPQPYPPNPPQPYPPQPYPPTPPQPYPPQPYPPMPPQPYPPQPYPPYEDPNRNWVCTTHSNGRNFSVPGRGYDLTRSKVIIVCRQSGFANPYECEQNARCQ